MQYPVDAYDLLELIPVGIRDTVQDGGVLDGMTPRDAAHHVDQTHCLACRAGLQRLVPQE